MTLLRSYAQTMIQMMEMIRKDKEISFVSFSSLFNPDNDMIGKNDKRQ
jgi:hypothetical protein